MFHRAILLVPCGIPGKPGRGGGIGDAFARFIWPKELTPNQTVVRLEDREDQFVVTDHEIEFADLPLGVVTRLAVHPETDVLNRRIVRLRKMYAAEKTCRIQ